MFTKDELISALQERMAAIQADTYDTKQPSQNIRFSTTGIEYFCSRVRPQNMSPRMVEFALAKNPGLATNWQMTHLGRTDVETKYVMRGEKIHFSSPLNFWMISISANPIIEDAGTLGSLTNIVCEEIPASQLPDFESQLLSITREHFIDEIDVSLLSCFKIYEGWNCNAFLFETRKEYLASGWVFWD